MMRWPPEHGAWAMILASWGCGWAAARAGSWEVLLIPPAAWLAFAAARSFRARRKGSSRSLLPSIAAGLAAAALAAVAVREAPLGWMVAMAAPSMAYLAVLSFADERSPGARLLATLALSAAAPAAFGAAGGSFGRPAALLWAAIAGYFVLVSCLVMARLRSSGGALWGARIGSVTLAGAAVTAAACGAVAWLAAPVFLIHAARAWSPAPANRPDPAAAGKAELVFGAVAIALLAAGL